MKKIVLVIASITFIAAAVIGGFANSDADEEGIPRIKAVVKPEKATIGDILDFRINIAGKKLQGLEILPPEKRDFYPEKENKKKKKKDEEKKPSEEVPLYIIHNIRKDDRSDRDMTDVTVIMSLSYYRTGKYELPAIEIKGPDKTLIGYKSPVIEIAEVNKDGQFQQIEPPLDLGGNYTRLIFLVLGVIGATILAVLIVQFIRKKREEMRQAPVIIPPIETFMKDIGSFKGRKLIQDGKVDDYVFGISIIFRRFLSSQFHFDAMEMTTEEIEKTMKQSSFKPVFEKYEDELVKIFHLWDLSKFAEFTPTDEVLYVNLDHTIDMAKKLSGFTDIEEKETPAAP